MSITHVQSTSKSKSAYFCLLRMRNVSNIGFGKFQYKKLWLLPEKIRKVMFVFFTNDKIWSFEKLSVFPERPIDFRDFQE